MLFHHRKVGMVWAEGQNREIGRDGDLPWHLPEDLKHFQEITADSTVIMGRSTWESLPVKYRPLKGRHNIVVTSSENQEDFAGAVIAHSLEEAMELAPAHVDVWIIGGSRLFAEAMPLAHIIEVTEVDVRVHDADTYAPHIPDEFGLKHVQSWWDSKNSGLRYRFVTYERGYKNPIFSA